MDDEYEDLFTGDTFSGNLVKGGVYIIYEVVETYSTKQIDVGDKIIYIGAMNYLQKFITCDGIKLSMVYNHNLDEFYSLNDNCVYRARLSG